METMTPCKFSIMLSIWLLALLAPAHVLVQVHACATFHDVTLSAPAGLATAFGAGSVPDSIQAYANQLSVCFYVSAPAGFAVRLEFTHFEIETSASCTYDYVSIKDGPTSVDPPLTGVLFGNLTSSLPPVMVSSSTAVTVQFVTDNSLQGLGFRVIASAVRPGTQEVTVLNTHAWMLQRQQFYGLVACWASPSYVVRCALPTNVTEAVAVETSAYELDLGDELSAGVLGNPTNIVGLLLAFDGLLEVMASGAIATRDAERYYRGFTSSSTFTYWNFGQGFSTSYIGAPNAAGIVGCQVADSQDTTYNPLIRELTFADTMDLENDWSVSNRDRWYRAPDAGSQTSVSRATKCVRQPITGGGWYNVATWQNTDGHPHFQTVPWTRRQARWPPWTRQPSFLANPPWATRDSFSRTLTRPPPGSLGPAARMAGPCSVRPLSPWRSRLARRC